MKPKDPSINQLPATVQLDLSFAGPMQFSKLEVSRDCDTRPRKKVDTLRLPSSAVSTTNNTQPSGIVSGIFGTANEMVVERVETAYR
jgi:hypothetical protein